MGLITYHDELIQGSKEWAAARCGLLTASEMKLILTPTLKVAANQYERSHLYELLSQRITGHVEAAYISSDMLRGQEEEVDAKLTYAANYAPVADVGFVTNDRWGFTLGYSPDGLVGDDGLIECKSRRQKYQIETMLECVAADTAPAEFMLQLQTGLLVSERAWIDFVSYSGGLPMVTIRVFPDPAIQAAIIEAATAFEARLAEKLAAYRKVAVSGARLVETERRTDFEMYV